LYDLLNEFGNKAIKYLSDKMTVDLWFEFCFNIPKAEIANYKSRLTNLGIFDKIQNIAFQYDEVINYNGPLLMDLIETNGFFITRFTKSPRLCEEAIKQNPFCSRFCGDEYIDKGILADPQVIFGNTNANPTRILMAWKGNDESDMLRFLSRTGKFKSYNDVVIAALKKDGLALQYVDKQTDEICTMAVKQNGLALQYVDKQTDEICIIAVKQNGLALNYVKNKTSKICLVAILQNYEAKRFIS
jgi:hypothetical protein